MRQPRTKENAAGPHSDADVAVIRANIEAMNDGQIAALLGWKIWKVVAVRDLHGIPAHVPRLVWSKEDIEVLKARYVRAGEPASVVGKAIGKTAAQVAKKAHRLGLKRDPCHKLRNTAAVSRQNSPFTPGHSIRRPARSVAPESVPKAVERRHFGNSAFSPSQRERAPLGDRILRELAQRPLSAATLASLTGDKEAYVSLQLSALAHDGRVRAGEGGPRERRWSLAA